MLSWVVTLQNQPRRAFQSPTAHRPNSFRIRTSEKCARNSFRIRRSENTGLKVLWNPHLHRNQGEGCKLLTSFSTKGIYPEPRFVFRDLFLGPFRRRPCCHRDHPRAPAKSAKMGLVNGGDTVSTEAVAARRHAGVHLPVTWWKLEMPTTTWHLQLN